MNFNLIKSKLEELKLPAWRLKQLRQAYFKDLLDGWDSVTTLSKDMKAELVGFDWDGVKPKVILNSKSGTAHKALFELKDGKFVEAVLMVYEGRITVCISSQVGCNMGCTFCATGRGGFGRNLEPYEIVDQVVWWSRFVRQKLKSKGFDRVTNVVYMGMGEPFNNWPNVWE